MNNKEYFYDDNYYTLDAISEKYRKLALEQRKLFKDSLAHFTLVEILKKCNYDERIIDSVLDLAEIEATRIKLYGSDCGRILLALEGQYKREIRKLINLTGKLASRDDSRINRFTNGEWYINNLVCLTIGFSFEKDIIDDLFLIDCNSLTTDECQAIANNFVRDMNGEEIVFYNALRKMK